MNVQALALMLGTLVSSNTQASPLPSLANAKITPLAFSDLPGWQEDDHAQAFAVFRKSCEHLTKAPLRPGVTPPPSLIAACTQASSLPMPLAHKTARRFFEGAFVPLRIRPASGQGFFTGYFEPEVSGALEQTSAFPTPLLGLPEGHRSLTGEAPPLPSLDGLASAWMGPEGLQPYPDRAAIEQGALGQAAKPVVYVSDSVEAFIIHVQGSTRVRLPDSRTIRIAYAGRNGHPYTSIGRILVERGRIPKDEMSLERLMGWLRDNPDEARDIMRQNRSYIFFRVADELDADQGPIGGAGLPLTPGRSLAVDRSLWPYGLPIWIDVTVPTPRGDTTDIKRLMIAQDTGTAIVGPARADIFFGTGAAAGQQAGWVRHSGDFIVLWPKDH